MKTMATLDALSWVPELPDRPGHWLVTDCVTASVWLGPLPAGFHEGRDHGAW
jgi:hypothetical protein